MSGIKPIGLVRELFYPVGNYHYIHKSKSIGCMCELCITQIRFMGELYQPLIGFTHALLKRLYILKAFKKNAQKIITITR